ncbi:hypothetical protein J0383_18770 [Flavobacterium endoglycinae]|uniref:Uncharacterized protein n=1 Tax=Flavobacterium endoglycinae TaxID=2816357 RepID=A0ABX7QCF9_9FLAO|nr:hypothetical protein [Flavobacterium endoglycinae]QSW88293.1 hypothetical protein J0383_18770 [Flavobacterium endoglycinae]
MIQIKQLTRQEYENTVNKPSEFIVLYKTEDIEKQLISIIATHFAENIKEMIEYLQEVSKFDFSNREYIILETETKSLTAFFIEVLISV